MTHAPTSWDNRDLLTPPEHDEEEEQDRLRREADYADFLLDERRDREAFGF